MGVEETNCAIQWIVIHPVDSTIQRLYNRGLVPVVQTLYSAIHRLNHQGQVYCRKNV